MSGSMKTPLSGALEEMTADQLAQEKERQERSCMRNMSEEKIGDTSDASSLSSEESDTTQQQRM